MSLCNFPQKMRLASVFVYEASSGCSYPAPYQQKQRTYWLQHGFIINLFEIVRALFFPSLTPSCSYSPSGDFGTYLSRLCPFTSICCGLSSTRSDGTLNPFSFREFEAKIQNKSIKRGWITFMRPVFISSYLTSCSSSSFYLFAFLYQKGPLAGRFPFRKDQVQRDDVVFHFQKIFRGLCFQDFSNYCHIDRYLDKKLKIALINSVWAVFHNALVVIMTSSVLLWVCILPFRVKIPLFIIQSTFGIPKKRT